jgi:hypothetical protein
MRAASLSRSDSADSFDVFSVLTATVSAIPPRDELCKLALKTSPKNPSPWDEMTRTEEGKDGYKRHGRHVQYNKLSDPQ